MFINTITYSAVMDAQAFTTATDLFEVTPAADRAISIIRLTLGQTTDLGDAQEEVLRIGIYTDVTAGSTGTAITEAPYSNESGVAANTAAVVTNRGTASTGGTLIDIIPWNIRIAPFIWEPNPYAPVKFSNIAAEGPVSSFRLMSAPTDSITISGSLIWTEI
jgi:hypothetical protein